MKKNKARKNTYKEKSHLTMNSVNSSSNKTFGKYSIAKLNSLNYFNVEAHKFYLTINDATAIRCIELITNYTTNNGYLVKSKFLYRQDAMNSFLRDQKIESVNIEILNSILGVNGAILCFFVESLTGYEVVREPFYIHGKRRIDIEIEPNTRTVISYKVKNKETNNIIYSVNVEDCFLINPLNLENDFVGKTPLMYAHEAISEKIDLSIFNRETSQNAGRLQGTLSPKVELLKGLAPAEQLEYTILMGSTVDQIQTSTENKYQNYAFLPPHDFNRTQSSNTEMQFSERIRSLKYDICDFFGVPPSLVNFDESTAPSLNNGETNKDIFIQGTVNKYKTILEQYWTWLLSRTFTDWEFEFFIGREQTDESLQIRESLHKTIETAQLLNKIGIEVDIDTSLLNKIGLTIREKKDLTGVVVNTEEINIQNENKETQVSIIEEIDMIDKAVKAEKKYLELEPPSFKVLEKTKGYADFKKTLKASIKIQLDTFFSNIDILNKAIDKEAITNYIKDNLPKIDLTEAELFKILKDTLIPESLKLYNDFYKQNYTIDNLPDELQRKILELCKATISGTKNYEGIDNTLSERLYNLYTTIAKDKKIDLSDYSSMPNSQKKTVWQELKSKNQTILLQSRVDLVSQIIANDSLNQVVFELSKVDIAGRQVFVGAYTKRDLRVRDDHRANEGKYFDSLSQQPFLDYHCRCLYIWGTEEYLIQLGFTKK